MESKAEVKPSAVAEMLDTARTLIDAANAEYRSVKLPCGSRALAFAVEYGLKPRMSYTIAEAGSFTGIGDQTLRREHEAGRIRFIMPRGQSKGYRVAVDELDRWMSENEG